MKHFITYLFVFSVLGFAACEKDPPKEEPFLTNAFALQNDSNQQFYYTPEILNGDSMWLHFEAYTNGEQVPGIIDFYVLYTDTMDTLWLDTRAKYWYTYSDIIGDKYTLDSNAINYVLFETNNQIAKSSVGIFQAQFLIDTTIISRLDSLSPDTMRIDSGSFSGPYIE